MSVAAVHPFFSLTLCPLTGSWLLFWPCGWGLAQAAPAGCLPDPTLLAVYAAGAFVMRGAGCTINDMWDRDIDGKVSPLTCLGWGGARIALGIPGCCVCVSSVLEDDARFMS